MRLGSAFFLGFSIAGVACVHLFFAQSSKPWEWWLKFWSKALLKAVGVRLHFSGKAHNEPAIYIMNHKSMLDIMSLACVTPPKVTFISKKEIRSFPFIGHVMTKGGCIFIDRSKGGNAIESIREGLDNRKKDYSILMFPEGTRSSGEKMRPFKKGIYHICKQSNLPVVPVGQVGVDALKTKFGFKPGSMFLHMGEPIHLDQQESVEEFLAKCTQAVEGAIASADKKRLQAYTNNPSRQPALTI